MSIQYSTQVNLVSDLFSLRAQHNQLFQTLGYSVKGIGSNLYRYDAGSTATIDGGFTLPGIGGTLSFSGTTFNGVAGTGRFIAIDKTTAKSSHFGIMSGSDNSNLMQIMVNAAISSNAGKIVVEGGTINATGLTITSASGLQIECNGATIQLPPSGNYPIFTITSSTNVTLSNISINGNRSNAGVADAFLIRVLDCNNFQLKGGHFTNNVAGIRVGNSPRSVIEGLSCYDFTSGQVTIKDGSSRTSVSQVVANDNGNMLNSLHIIDVEATTSSLDGVVVSESSFYANGTSIQLTGAYVTNTAIYGNACVNTDLTGAGNCIKLDTIGVNNAVTNNTLVFTNYGIFEVAGTPVTIRGNSLTKSTSSFTGLSHAIRVGTSNCTISNNTINSPANHGITLGSSVDYCVIEGNTINSPGQDGINTEASSSNNNFIRFNTIAGALRYGIRIDGSDNVCSNNIIRNGSGVYGVYCAGNNCTLLDNHLENNAVNYIRFNGNSGVVVRVNNASNVSNLPVGNKLMVNTTLLAGTGSPEGALTSSVGSLYLRSDGGTSTTLYVKESGAGNTGWVAK